MKVDLKKWMKRVTDSTPVGMIVGFAGSTAPTGWLLCQGQAVSRTTYAKLFSVIGTTFGSGDGSTTFNLPDARGRVLVGVGESSATGHTNHTLGQKGGEETHKLTVSEMPSHNHTYNHCKYKGQNLWGLPSYNYSWDTYQEVADTTGDTGGNGSHNNMMPYLTANAIIYVGGVARSILKALQSLLYRKAVIA